jgi:sarcosine oxidase subunit alpha
MRREGEINAMKDNLRIMNHPVLQIKRGDPITFHFNGRPIAAYNGETIAAALYAAGVRIFSRSFKYHRPRGLFCLAGHCSNCLMRVDGIPNVRTCVESVRSGMNIESQNAWPSLNFDLAAITGYLDFLVRPGFQYKRFIRFKSLYLIWERFLRRMAGIGKLPDTLYDSPTARNQAEPEIVIVGGGVAGLSAALQAADAGSEVWLIEKENILGGRMCYDTAVYESIDSPTKQHGFSVAQNLAKEIERRKGCRVLKEATAFAWYDEDILAVSRPGEFWEIKPRRVIIATGSYENPMVFGNNDLPGIFLAGALQRLMHGDLIRPGKKAIVVTNNGYGHAVAAQLRVAGVDVGGIVDQRPKTDIVDCREAEKTKAAGFEVYAECELKAAIGCRKVKGVIVKSLNEAKTAKSAKEIKLACDVICVAGSHTPANELVFQRTCQGAYILESQNQYTRRPNSSSHMQVDRDMYVAGAAGGSNNLQRALLEGKIAGLSAALGIGYGDQKTEALRDESAKLLDTFQN